jgi:hypothetical protein
MTLIVGALDGTSVTITGDTKITYDEDAIKSARLFDEALPKIVLLRDNLAVGVAGAGPQRMIEDLVKVRDADLVDVLDHLRAERDGDFVVGALNPARLYEVRGSTVTPAPSAQRAWAGDGNAFEEFESLAASWLAEDDEFTRLKTSMDSVVSRGRTNSVGGFALTARTDDGRFRFIPTAFTIFGVDDLLDTYEGQVLPGDGPTPGALGIYVSRAEVGRLFTHERPFEGIKIAAPDRATFADRAFAEFGQTLLVW